MAGRSSGRHLSQSPESTSKVTHLYSLRRPLWGSLSREQSGAVQIADANIFEEQISKNKGRLSEVEALAVLSYRVNFYVALPSLLRP